jgi:hypothetical protein
VHPQGDVAEWLGTGLQNPLREFESPRRLTAPQFSPFACIQLRSIRVLGALLRRAYTICNQKLSEWREVLAVPPRRGGAARGGGQRPKGAGRRFIMGNGIRS